MKKSLNANDLFQSIKHNEMQIREMNITQKENELSEREEHMKQNLQNVLNDFANASENHMQQAQLMINNCNKLVSQFELLFQKLNHLEMINLNKNPSLNEQSEIIIEIQRLLTQQAQLEQTMIQSYQQLEMNTQTKISQLENHLTHQSNQQYTDLIKTLAQQNSSTLRQKSSLNQLVLVLSLSNTTLIITLILGVTVGFQNNAIKSICLLILMVIIVINLIITFKQLQKGK